MDERMNRQEEPDRIQSYNNEVLEMLGKYLNNSPDFIQKELIEEIVNECHVTLEYAFTVLLAAACGLDTEENLRDEEMFRQYFLPMIRQLNADEYYSNPYYRNITIPNINIGGCELKNISYKPYEAFVYDDLEEMDDGRILPQIGFFNKEFSYPALLEEGRIWMTITPNEIKTMKMPVDQAYGKVLTYGLGLGYYTYMISEKEDVSSIIVVELNEDVIQMFETHILPQFKNASKIRIIKADAFSYAKEHMSNERFDFVFTDLWHDVSDGIEMYHKMKDYEKLCPDTTFAYWIEKSMLCYL